MTGGLTVLVGPAAAAGLDAVRGSYADVLRLGPVLGLVADQDCPCTSTPAALAWLYWEVAERLAGGAEVLIDATAAGPTDRVALLAVARENAGVCCPTAVIATAGVLDRLGLADGGVLEARVDGPASRQAGADLLVVHHSPAGGEQVCYRDRAPVGGMETAAAARLAQAAAALGPAAVQPAPAPSVRQLLVEGWRRVLDVDPAGHIDAVYSHDQRCPQCAASSTPARSAVAR